MLKEPMVSSMYFLLGFILYYTKKVLHAMQSHGKSKLWDGMMLISKQELIDLEAGLNSPLILNYIIL